MITNNLSTLNIHQLSEQQFQRIVENNEYDENALYLTPDKEVLIVTIDEETGMASHTPAEIYAHVQSSGMAVLNEINNWGITLNYMGGAEDYASFGAWLDELRSVYVTIYSDGHMDFREPNYVLSDAVDNKITRPNTAEVGQTIVVKSIDENGQPTEWEAVNFPKEKATKLITLLDVTIENEMILAIDDTNTCTFGDAVVLNRRFFYKTPEGDQLKASRIFGYIYVPSETTLATTLAITAYCKDGDPNAWNFGDLNASDGGFAGLKESTNIKISAGNYYVFQVSVNPILARCGTTGNLTWEKVPFRNMSYTGSMNKIVTYISGLKISPGTTTTFPAGSQFVIKAEVEDA